MKAKKQIKKYDLCIKNQRNSLLCSNYYFLFMFTSIKRKENSAKVGGGGFFPEFSGEIAVPEFRYLFRLLRKTGFCYKVFQRCRQTFTVEYIERSNERTCCLPWKIEEINIGVFFSQSSTRLCLEFVPLLNISGQPNYLSCKLKELHGLNCKFPTHHDVVFCKSRFWQYRWTREVEWLFFLTLVVYI